MLKRSFDGGCLGQIMALIDPRDVARDAKEHGGCSLPAVVRRAGHPWHNVGHFSVEPLMARKQLHASRIIITDTPEGLRVVIPYRRSWFVSGFLGFWISGWAVAEVLVPLQFMKGDAPAEGASLMYAWLAVWTAGGLLAIYAWLWQVIGKEIVTVHGQTCTVRRDIAGFGFDKRYDLVQMRNLRVEPAQFNPLDISSVLQLWGIGGGTIAFDFGSRTHRFATGLDETEASQAVTVIKKRCRI